MNSRALHFLSFSLGCLLLFHGIDKLRHGVEFIDNMVIAYIVPYNKPHLPFFSCFNFGVDVMESILIAYSVPYAKHLSYGVYLAEVVAPIFLIFGRHIRVASAIIICNMSMAMLLIYQGKLFTLGNHGAWRLEVPMLYFIMAMILVVVKKS